MAVDLEPTKQQFRSDGRQMATVRCAVKVMNDNCPMPSSRYLIYVAMICRLTSCRLGILERAAGSAQWESEHTRVVAAVQGPFTLGGRREDPKKAVVEVIFQSCNGLGGAHLGVWLASHYAICSD